MHKRGLCRHAVSVCPSVHLFVTFVDSVETSKPIFKIVSCSGGHTTLVIPHHTSWKYSDGNPLTGASNAGWVGKNIAIFDKYLAIGSMTAAVVNSNCDGRRCSLPHRPPCISESCLSQSAWTTTTKRREQHIMFLCSGKSEAEITNDRRLRTIEANYWQTRSIAAGLLLVFTLLKWQASRYPFSLLVYKFVTWLSGLRENGYVNRHKSFTLDRLWFWILPLNFRPNWSKINKNVIKSYGLGRTILFCLSSILHVEVKGKQTRY